MPRAHRRPALTLPMPHLRRRLGRLTARMPRPRTRYPSRWMSRAKPILARRRNHPAREDPQRTNSPPLCPCSTSCSSASPRPDFKFVFSSTLFSPEEYESIVNHPPLLDPDGGARRRAAQARKQQELQGDDERAKKALQASAEANLDDVPGSGSLQLGGEPVDGRQGSEAGGAQDQQRPLLGGQAFPFGQGQAGDALVGLFAQGRSFTPTQQQQPQFSLLKSGDPQAAPQGQHLQANIFQNQSQQLAAAGHARQSSRYTFANDSASASAAVKPAANARLMAQQSAMMPGSQNHPPQQYAGQYTAAQGPPPGLKSSGTPPIGGAGMFAQGHGGLGRNATTLDEKSELLRDMFRHARRGGAARAAARRRTRPSVSTCFLRFCSSTPAAAPLAPAPGPRPALSTARTAVEVRLPSSRRTRSSRRRRGRSIDMLTLPPLGGVE